MPFEDASELDGIVGSVEGVAGSPPPASSTAGEVHVTISGDDVSGLAAQALAHDLEHVIRAFHGNASTGDHDLVPHLADLPSRRERDINIALHGLRLDPDAEGALRDLVSKYLEAGTNPESST
jgi:hypothetical protein